MEGDRGPASSPLYHEEVLVEIGERHLSKMDTIVDPLVVSDLATVVWSPHGHPEAVDSLLRLAQVVLIDSESEPDPASAAAARPRAEGAGVRRGPRLAALHTLAGAGGGDLRSRRSGGGSCPRSARSPPATGPSR